MLPLDPKLAQLSVSVLLSEHIIAILGWGSLYREPRNLDFDGRWRDDGPFLPIEFARVSSDGRLTLVIYPHVPKVRTLWTISRKTTLDTAIGNLMEREGIKNRQYIGYESQTNDKINNKYDEISKDILFWTKRNGFHEIIWTNLPSNSLSKKQLEFNEENSIEHIKGPPCVRIVDVGTKEKYP